ncbi:RNA polymerase sigma factor [Sphingobacterium suaedae]|uniref:RNA polymerase sigma factor n=1 Tax=Sphingobacterium suaedae TaxID=1686402 RepID=A0ABW5KK58_9SPHI
MMGINDVQLFARIRDDDRSAFAELVDRYSGILYRFILKRTGSKEDTQDILQDIFASFWKRRHQLIVTESLYPYLFKSARYAVIDWMIKKQKDIVYASSLLAPDGLQPLAESFEDTLLAKELRELINTEVDKMPKTMKNIFRMSRQDAMSNKEIAVKLALSEQTVKNNISLAINKLKIIFK